MLRCFKTQKERVIRAFRQIMVTDAKLTSIAQAAVAVKADVALKQHSP